MLQRQGEDKHEAGPGNLCIRFPCPSCGRALTIPLSAATRTYRCPGCSATFRGPSTNEGVSASGSAQDLFRPAPKSKTDETAAVFRQRQTGGGAANNSGSIDTGSDAETDSDPLGIQRIPLRPMFSPAEPAAQNDGVVTSHTPMFAPVRQWPLAKATARFLGRRFNYLSTHRRLHRKATFLGIWFGPVVAIVGLAVFMAVAAIISGNRTAAQEAASAAGAALACWSMPWILFGHWPARWFTPLVLSWLACTACCPHCGEQYDLVDRWKCGCGYVDHRDRHFYRFHCPLCHKRLGHMNCQRCQATILL